MNKDRPESNEEINIKVSKEESKKNRQKFSNNVRRKEGKMDRIKE